MSLEASAIGPARAADIPALCGLLGRLFAQEAEFAPDEAAQRRGLAAIIADPDVGALLVARDGGKVVGMVNLLYTVSTALGASVALLEDLVVAPTARGRGIGSALLKHAIEHARAQGCRRITLLTDTDNAAAHRLYQKHGFAFSAMAPMRLMPDD